MLGPINKLGRTAIALILSPTLLFLGFGVRPANGSTTAASARQSSAASVPGLLVANDETWSPEGLEDLLAPVALYPDEIIGHVLVAATNPQEVLDAGDWRTKHLNLSGTALDAAAKTAGFTPPARLLIQNSIVLDMMCSEFGWTQELGQAFVNDQAEVLDAIQRLRHQARDAGNLRSSDKLIV